MNRADLFTTTAPASALFVRLGVAFVFLTAGSLKFIDPGEYGTGRFVNLGFPVPEVFGPLVGTFEVLCGILVLAGLLTRLAAIPLAVIMVVAIIITKVPTLLEDGFWDFMNDARLDVAMLGAALFLVFAGSGPWSADARIAESQAPRPAPRRDGPASKQLS